MVSELASVVKPQASRVKQTFVVIAMFFTALGGVWAGLRAVEAAMEMTLVTHAQAAENADKMRKEWKDADASMRADFSTRLDYVDSSLERTADMTQKIYEHLLAGSLNSKNQKTK